MNRFFLTSSLALFAAFSFYPLSSLAQGRNDKHMRHGQRSYQHVVNFVQEYYATPPEYSSSNPTAALTPEKPKSTFEKTVEIPLNDKLVIKVPGHTNTPYSYLEPYYSGTNPEIVSNPPTITAEISRGREPIGAIGMLRYKFSFVRKGEVTITLIKRSFMNQNSSPTEKFEDDELFITHLKVTD